MTCASPDNRFGINVGDEEFGVSDSLSGGISSNPLLSPLFSRVRQFLNDLTFNPGSGSLEHPFSLKSSLVISSSSKESWTTTLATLKCAGLRNSGGNSLTSSSILVKRSSEMKFSLWSVIPVSSRAESLSLTAPEDNFVESPVEKSSPIETHTPSSDSTFITICESFPNWTTTSFSSMSTKSAPFSTFSTTGTLSSTSDSAIGCSQDSSLTIVPSLESFLEILVLTVPLPTDETSSSSVTGSKNIPLLEWVGLLSLRCLIKSNESSGASSGSEIRGTEWQLSLSTRFTGSGLVINLSGILLEPGSDHAGESRDWREMITLITTSYMTPQWNTFPVNILYAVYRLVRILFGNDQRKSNMNHVMKKIWSRRRNSKSWILKLHVRHIGAPIITFHYGLKSLKSPCKT